MKKYLLLGFLSLGSLALSTNAMASIDLFGYTFADSAFSDDAELVSGDISCLYGWTGGEGPASELPIVLNGSDLHTYFEGKNFGTYSSTFAVDVIYKDNYIFNGPGADLAVWERYNPEGFSLSIFDPFNSIWTNELSFQPATVGYLYEEHAYREVNLALVDFDQFGIASSTNISRVRISSHASEFSPDIAAVGGLNSRAVIPEPSSLLLLGLGGLLLKRRKR